jgi:hypothetical protein
MGTLYVDCMDHGIEIGEKLSEHVTIHSDILCVLNCYGNNQVPGKIFKGVIPDDYSLVSGNFDRIVVTDLVFIYHNWLCITLQYWKLRYQ